MIQWNLIILEPPCSFIIHIKREKYVELDWYKRLSLQHDKGSCCFTLLTLPIVISIVLIALLNINQSMFLPLPHNEPYL